MKNIFIFTIISIGMASQNVILQAVSMSYEHIFGTRGSKSFNFFPKFPCMYIRIVFWYDRCIFQDLVVQNDVTQIIRMSR